MRTQQLKLLSQLESHGWTKLEDPETRTRDWWTDEIWVLASLWRPQECRVYLTFVVDPQWEGPRSPGEGVWCLTAALAGPAQWSPVKLPLGRGWEAGLAKFFQGLGELREAWEVTA